MDEADAADLTVEQHLKRALTRRQQYTIEEPLPAERDALQADAERYRWLFAQIQHQHSGPYSGWTLDMLYPGDDPEAAIDAAMTKEAK